MLLQVLQSWLEHVQSPLVRVYGAKFREEDDQAVRTPGSASAVAAQGDAGSNGSPQCLPYNPFPHVAFPSEPPPPIASTSNYLGFPSTADFIRAKRVICSQEAPSRPLSDEDSFEHSLPVPTPRHTVSLLRMAVGPTFDIQVPGQRAAALVPNHDGKTFTIGSYTEKASTIEDIARLPSLESEDLLPSESTEIDMTLSSSSSRSSRKAELSPLEELSECGPESLSEVILTPGVRKMNAKLQTHAANEWCEIGGTEVCLNYAECQGCPRIQRRGNRAVFKPVVSVTKAKATCSVPMRENYNRGAPLITPRRRRSRVPQLLRRVLHRLCSCIRPEFE
ncbi:hypothetical protein AAHC03_020974 [Spirometra sp. Aus1]